MLAVTPWTDAWLFGRAVAAGVVALWLVQEWVVHKWLLHSSFDWAGENGPGHPLTQHLQHLAHAVVLLELDQQSTAGIVAGKAVERPAM